MRERVRYGEVGRRELDGKFATGFEGEGAGEGAGVPPRWRVRAWRHAAGPRPVRPGVVPVGVRPPEAPRPTGSPGRPAAEQRWGVGTGLRLLARRSAAAPARCAGRYRLRRAVAGVALLAATAAAVVALGVLARLAEPASPVRPAAASVASAASAAPPPAPVVVTAVPGDTVWEVADRVAPGLPGPQRAALAERIVADNALSSVRLQPGQVLRVAGG